MTLINFKEYSKDNFCKRILIRAKQLAFDELEKYREVIILPTEKKEGEK